MAVAAPEQNHKTKITVKAVRVLKEGVNQKTGRPWTLYAVEAENEKGRAATLTTFHRSWLDRIGQTHEVDYKVVIREKDGKTYEDLRIIDPHGGEQVQLLTEIRDLLRDLLTVMRR